MTALIPQDIRFDLIPQSSDAVSSKDFNGFSKLPIGGWRAPRQNRPRRRTRVRQNLPFPPLNSGGFAGARPSPTVSSEASTAKAFDLPAHGPVVATLWDTAGQESFRALIPGYCRGAHLALVVASSFDSLPQWLRTVSSASEAPAPAVLVVNKMDLAGGR
jgi:GTPase SAR1 family protein